MNTVKVDSKVAATCRCLVIKYAKQSMRIADAFQLFDDLTEALENTPSKLQFQGVVKVLQEEFKYRITVLDELLVQKYGERAEKSVGWLGYKKMPDKQLIRLYQDTGDKEALAAFIKKNMGLVYKQVRRYAGPHISLDEDDLAQLGVIGMIRGVEKFKLEMDNAVSTYVVHWITQSITRGIMDEGYLIRLPVHLHEVLQRLNRIERWRISTQLDEVDACREMNISIERYYKLKYYSELYLRHTSLYTPVGGDGGSGETELLELLPQQDEIQVEDEVMQAALRENLDEVLETLTEREEKVMRLRFGIDDNHERTLEEVGLHFGVTRERIRQIEEKALRKLRHPSRSKKLKDFL